MTILTRTILTAFLLCAHTGFAGAQTPPSAAMKEPAKTAEQPAKPAAAAELNGYKQAAWGISEDEVKTTLNIEFANTEPSTSVTELPWELMRLAGISDSDPDYLLRADLRWFQGENQETMLGFYKDRFFFYTSALDKIIPLPEYEKKLAALHGPFTRELSFQNIDPADKKVTGSYAMKIWEKKKTTAVLGIEKLFPTSEPETNCEISYISADIFGEFKNDFAVTLAKKKEIERKEAEKALKEHETRALDVLQ